MASIRKNIRYGKICLVTDQPLFRKDMRFDELSFQAAFWPGRVSAEDELT